MESPSTAAMSGGKRRFSDELEPSISPDYAASTAAKRLRQSHDSQSLHSKSLSASQSIVKPSMCFSPVSTLKAHPRVSSLASEISLDSSSDFCDDPSIPPIFPELRGRLADAFDLDGSILGSGQFGTVRRCVYRATGQAFACKSIPKARLVDPFVRQEVKMEVLLMQQRLNVVQSPCDTSAGGAETMSGGQAVDQSPSRVSPAAGATAHPGIVRLHAVFEDEETVDLVMDLCDAGDLYDEVVRRGNLPEKEAAFLFRQIASALAFCHARGVMHRDLKPENILLHKRPDAAADRLTVKLADFGLAIPLSAGETARGVAGSTFYMAPEVLSGDYSHSADIWSLGVILFTMLSGTVPFCGADNSESAEAVLNGRLDFSGPEWVTISAEAKSLIRCMLHRDPQRRPTAAKVLSHPWVLVNVFGGRIVRRVVARPLEIAVSAGQNNLSVEKQGLVQQRDLPPREHLPEGILGH